MQIFPQDGGALSKRTNPRKAGKKNPTFMIRQPSVWEETSPVFISAICQSFLIKTI